MAVAKKAIVSFIQKETEVVTKRRPKFPARPRKTSLDATEHALKLQAQYPILMAELAK